MVFIALLIPIGMSALGYVIYELVKMGMKEFKEYVEKGGGCAEGTVFYMVGEDGILHCWAYDPDLDCPGEGNEFGGIAADGKVYCNCKNPYIPDGLGGCILPQGHEDTMTWQEMAALCPENTSFVGVYADGTIVCECYPPNVVTPDGQCITPVVQTTVSAPAAGGVPTASVAPKRKKSQMNLCIEAMIAQGFSQEQAAAHCYNKLVPKEVVKTLQISEAAPIIRRVSFPLTTLPIMAPSRPHIQRMPFPTRQAALLSGFPSPRGPMGRG